MKDELMELKQYIKQELLLEQSKRNNLIRQFANWIDGLGAAQLTKVSNILSVLRNQVVDKPAKESAENMSTADNLNDPTDYNEDRE